MCISNMNKVIFQIQVTMGVLLFLIQFLLSFPHFIYFYTIDWYKVWIIVKYYILVLQCMWVVWLSKIESSSNHYDIFSMQKNTKGMMILSHDRSKTCNALMTKKISFFCIYLLKGWIVDIHNELASVYY